MYPETNPGVEGHPIKDEVELAFDKEEEGEGGPVHEPWGEDGGVGGAEGFVGGEDGEEDGSYGAGIGVAVSGWIGGRGWGQRYVRMSAMKPNMLA